MLSASHMHWWRSTHSPGFRKCAPIKVAENCHYLPHLFFKEFSLSCSLVIKGTWRQHTELQVWAGEPSWDVSVGHPGPDLLRAWTATCSKVAGIITEKNRNSARWWWHMRLIPSTWMEWMRKATCEAWALFSLPSGWSVSQHQTGIPAQWWLHNSSTLCPCPVELSRCQDSDLLYPASTSDNIYFAGMSPNQHSYCRVSCILFHGARQSLVEGSGIHWALHIHWGWFSPFKSGLIKA